MVAIVGAVDGVYKSRNEITIHEYSYQGGLRLRLPTDRVSAFGQMLAGAATAGRAGASVTGFSIQPGGGVDVKATETVGVRVAVDFRHGFFSTTNGGDENDVRLAVGVVLGIGR
jgi:hypothetical protein